MPVIRLKSGTTVLGTRREVLHAVSWQVRSSVWSPPTDAYETDDAYIVRVEIAGMQEDDFEVSLENHTLFISGTRPELRERRAYHQMEIHFGKFAPAVGIPVPVDADLSTAEYRDGFLTVTLPKKISN
ncbi:MAG: Hsp20/alpha crystallin family protein [Anaerolineaceae bacterium]|nr:Hsp20/alpha crystallin family protein [Anaerolineaceae bacterium]